MIQQESVNRQAKERFKAREKEREAKCCELSNLAEGGTFSVTQIDEIGRIAERAKRLGLFEDAVALLSSPEDESIATRVYEKIIGSNDILGIRFVKKAASLSRAVGRIVLGVQGGTRLGTGFMVSPRLMMTNNHVLGSMSEGQRAAIEFDFYERDNGSTGPLVSYRLQPELFFVTDAPLDFTIVAVAPVSGSDTLSNRGWFPLISQSGKAVIGERVTIIQHPNGEPQKITIHNNKIVDVVDDFLHYETDTMGGSSGSAVCNANWDLAALHHAAVGGMNEGVRISSIIRRLREILGQESAGNTEIGKLAEELLAGMAPPEHAYSSPTELTSPSGKRQMSDNPRVDSNGNATWTIPLSVSVNLAGNEHSSISSLSRHNTADGQQPKGSSLAPRAGLGEIDDPEVQLAIEAAENAASRVYYSKSKDEADRDAYYPSLSNMNKKRRYEVLSEHLQNTHTKTLSYKTARLVHLYPWIDRRDDPEKSLKGIYSGKTFDVLEIIRQEASMEMLRREKIEERMRLESSEPIDEEFLATLEAAHPFNCEHVVPQSWFQKKKQPKADMHHLFTCEWGCNSFRGNRAYFDFELEAFRDACGESDKGKFEPHKGKGAAARATLYFLVRYPGEVSDIVAEMPRDRVKTLIDWAKADKVDRWELHRNAEIAKIQGNRNPFIDFPDLVDKVDFAIGFA